MSWEQIQTAGMVIFAALGGVVTIGKVINLIRGWFKAIGNRRETEIDRLNAGQKILFQAILALLHHQLTGSNEEQLRNVQTRLIDYIVNK